MDSVRNIKNSKISLLYLSLIFMVPFSGFYITKLSVSPVYLSSFLGLCFFLLAILFGTKIKKNGILSLALFFLFYIASSQIIFDKPNMTSYLNFMLSLIIFIGVYIVSAKVPTLRILRLSRFFILVSIPLLVVESYIRLRYPPIGKIEQIVSAGREDIMFYIFKFNSIMYQDSNFVAMFILPLFFFQLYINDYIKKRNLFITASLAMLLLMTISRAAILAMILFYVFYLYRAKLYKMRKIITCLLFIIVPLVYTLTAKFAFVDDSFASKFMIVNIAIDYLKSVDIVHFLFGVGIGNAVSVLNIGAHNIIVSLIVETGIIGLTFNIVLWLMILFKTKYKAGIIMFPFSFAGLSFASLAIPFLYVMFAIVIVLESRKKQIAK